MNRLLRIAISIPTALIVLTGCATTRISLSLPDATSTPAHGRVESGTIDSAALTGNLLGDPSTRGYKVYLPPGYDLTDRSFPVVFVLHGYCQHIGDYFKRLAVSEDQRLSKHEAEGLILVFPDGYDKFGGSWYLSSPTIGDYETYISEELVSQIDSTYRTLPNRESRGITGCSMGGFGAAHLGLKYPGVFSVAAPVSGVYSWEREWWDNSAKLFKSEPKSQQDWLSLDFDLQARLSSAAASAPNPDKPPFYLDVPFKLVDGKGQVVDEVYQKIAAQDPAHDAQRYLGQPIRLKGFMIYHGSVDSNVPVQHARAFDALLSTMGVDHVYIEVQGAEHCALDWDWGAVLQDMFDHLVQ